MGKDFEWDENKRRRNLEKHGIDFEEARDMFDGRPVFEHRSDRDFEQRFATTAELRGALFTAIWSPRDGRIRLISVRSAG